MVREWFCQVGERQYGPLTFQQLQRMAASGQLSADAPVRQGDAGQWHHASTIAGIFPNAAPPTAPSEKVVQEPKAAQVRPVAVARPSTRKAVAPSPVAPRPVAPSPVAGPALVRPVGDASPAGTQTVGTSVPGPATPHVRFTSSPAPASAHPNSRSAKSASHRSSNIGWIWWTAGGSLTAVVVAAAVYLGSSQGGGKKSDSPVVAKAAPTSAATAPQPAAPANEKQNAGPDETVDRQQVLKSITSWRDLAKVSSVSSKTLGLKILAVWSGEGSSSEGQTIFVELSLTNLPTATTPLTYATWNGKAGAGPQAAFLADDSQRLGVAVASDKTPGVVRQTAPLRLAPGQSVEDVLPFRLPAGGFEHLQLVLPHAAIGLGDKHFGFKIPRAHILGERPKAAPAQVAQASPPPAAPPSLESPPPAAPANAGPPAMPAERTGPVPTAAAMAARKAENPDDDKVLSPEDIDRQLRDLMAKEKAQEARKKMTEAPNP